MKAQDFLNWMAATGTKTGKEVSERVGLHRTTAQDLVALAKSGEDLPIKRTVALAMTAVAQGLKPWDEYER